MATETKVTHTTGPWQVINGQVYAPWSKPAPFVDGEGREHADHRSGLIALVYGPGPGTGPDAYNGEENALLIAAAPDLLAALKALFADYKALADSGDAGNWSLEEQDEGKQALAAIAKAEGR